MSGFQVGDLVAAVPPDQCPEGADNHEGYDWSVFSLLGATPRRVEEIVHDPVCGPYIVVSGDPDPCCAGCFRRIVKADESFSEAIRACKPHRVGEPA